MDDKEVRPERDGGAGVVDIVAQPAAIHRISCVGLSEVVPVDFITGPFARW